MPKHKSKRFKIMLAAAATLLVVSGVWFATRSQPSPKKASISEVSATEAEKANKLSKPTTTTNASGDATTTTAETSVNNFAVVINRPVNGDTLPLGEGIEMRITISGSSSKTGSCAVTATGPSGQKVTKTASFVPQASYSSCAIDIPSSQLVAGEWTTSLTVTSGGATSKTITQKVTLQ